MRIPISWLKDYVNINMPVEELAEKLTIAGLEVEHIHYIGIEGGTDKDRLVWDDDLLILGQILQVEQHPNADRLVLTTVDYGAEEPKTVVTGAPNLFQYNGAGDLRDLDLFTAFALEGAIVYDGHKEGNKKMKLKGRPLRGIYNDSMVCSEKELGISEEHEGIIIMSGEGYEPGTPMSAVLGDAVLDIDIIPNIARCASILGVAREVAAITEQPLFEPSWDVVMEGAPIDNQVKLTTENPELNPRFVAIVIEGVEQKPSPYWMQHRLQLAGQRPINVVVDISNYVMLEMGQPNHTFDYDFLRKRADEYAGADAPVHINTRLAHEGETLTTLDGTVHKLQPHNILVTDPASNLSIGGIMGGLESEIQDDTTNVLLEAAAWNYINIRRSGHGLKINTEAGFRFSRGVHPSLAMLGAKRAAELLRQLAGGTVRNGIVDYYPNPAETVVVEFNPKEVKRLGGLDLSNEEIAALLARLGFTSVDNGDSMTVTVPDHRMDIEGNHDLVEEVCRMYGYDKLPSTIMEDGLPTQRSNVMLDHEEQIKDLLAQLGLQEVITYRLTTPAKEQRMLAADDTLDADERPYVTLANPITVDRVAMRHSLMASTLDIVAENSRFQDRIAIFEIGPIYLAAESGVLPEELTRLSIAMTGTRRPANWLDEPAGSIDFFDLKGTLEALFEQLHIDDVSYTAASHPTYRPGRTAHIKIGDKQVGIMGQLHPLVVDAYDMRVDDPVLAAELDVEALVAAIPERFRVNAVPVYPPVQEDLALVVDKAVPAHEVEEVIRRTGGFLLANVALFDVYEGDRIPAGKKSLAYHLSFQAPNRTLTDKEIVKQRKRILGQVDKRLGAKLRE